MERNRPPKDIFEALQRLLACNKTELAARLGVTPRTVQRWKNEGEASDPDSKAAEITARLMIATLTAGNCIDALKNKNLIF